MTGRETARLYHINVYCCETIPVDSILKATENRLTCTPKDPETLPLNPYILETQGVLGHLLACEHAQQMTSAEVGIK